MTTANSLVKVQFHGDTLDAVRDDGGTVWVSLRRCCENLGLSIDTQARKLKSKAWATTTEMMVDCPDGSQRSAFCIDLDTLPGWLFSIDARKVKEHVREKLARYQKEAARVLADHFFKRTPSPELDLSSVERIIEAVVSRQLAGLASSGRPVTPAMPRETVHERCRKKGWFCTSPGQRAEIRRLANQLLRARHGETPDIPVPGGACEYYLHQIPVLDEAIDRIWDEYRAADKDDTRRLFD